jgi:hypothetical protein
MDEWENQYRTVGPFFVYSTEGPLKIKYICDTDGRAQTEHVTNSHGGVIKIGPGCRIEAEAKDGEMVRADGITPFSFQNRKTKDQSVPSLVRRSKRQSGGKENNENSYGFLKRAKASASGVKVKIDEFSFAQSWTDVQNYLRKFVSPQFLKNDKLSRAADCIQNIVGGIISAILIIFVSALYAVAYKGKKVLDAIVIAVFGDDEGMNTHNRNKRRTTAPKTDDSDGSEFEQERQPLKDITNMERPVQVKGRQNKARNKSSSPLLRFQRDIGQAGLAASSGDEQGTILRPLSSGKLRKQVAR